MRKKYETPWIDIDLFEETDVIYASGINEDGSDNDDVDPFAEP